MAQGDVKRLKLGAGLCAIADRQSTLGPISTFVGFGVGLVAEGERKFASIENKSHLFSLLFQYLTPPPLWNHSIARPAPSPIMRLYAEEGHKHPRYRPRTGGQLRPRADGALAPAWMQQASRRRFAHSSPG